MSPHLFRGSSLTPRHKPNSSPTLAASGPRQEPCKVLAIMSYVIWGGNVRANRLDGLPLSGLNCLLVENRAPKDYDSGWGHSDLGRGAVEADGAVR